MADGPAGCGINTDNAAPTTSLNRLIEIYNEEHGTQLERISLEELLAITLTRLDAFYQRFCVDGFVPFLDTYYRYWLHT